MGLINCFQAGGPLYMGKPSSSRINDHRNGRETDWMRRTCKASETSGRKWGSWSQQRCTNVHSWSVRAGCVGREGRLPLIIATIATAGGLLLNGTAPVNAYGGTSWQSAKLHVNTRFVTYLDHDHHERENVCFPAICLPLV